MRKYGIIAKMIEHTGKGLLRYPEEWIKKKKRGEEDRD